MPGEQQIVEFQSAGADEHAFQVASMEGLEEISGLYRFRLELYSLDSKIKIEDVIAKTARIGLPRVVATSDGKKGEVLYNIFGMPSSFEQLDKQGQHTRYSVEVVPRLWRLSRTVQSRQWQNLNVPGIIGDILKDTNSYACEKGKDFDFKVTDGNYPKREFVVQYQESDLALVSRLAEHEGIFYVIVQTEDREKIVFADNAGAFETIPGDAVLKYLPQQGRGAAESGRSFEEEVVSGWVCRQEEGPAKVQLADWNFRTPDVNLVVEAEVQSTGKGKVYEYGNHYKTKAEGEALAKVRADAIKCRLKRFDGASNCRRLRAGAKFKLEGHYRDTFNGEYLVTSVRHRAVQPVQESKSGSATLKYENTFVAIPADATFRPERRTPLPKISGIMTGLVHAPEAAEHPELDDDGSYRVRLPFDIKAPADENEKPSRPIRMAQPGAGPDHGLHLPLKGKSEAVLGFSGGDPDRPIIVGAVPNPKNGSPVKGANKSQQMWKSGANNMISFDDKKDSEKVFVHGQKDLHLRVKNDTVTWVGRDQHVVVKQHANEKIEGNQNKSVVGNEVKKIDGNKELSLKGDSVSKIKGNLSLKVDGDVAEVIKGNHAEDCEGKIYLKASGITIEATSGITLKCGSNSVVIDGSGVTLNGMLIAHATSIKMAMGPGSNAESGQAGSASDPGEPEQAIDADEPQAPGSGEGELGSGSGGSAVPVPVPPPPPHRPDPARTHWIEIEMEDQDEHPAAGVAYQIRLPTGHLASGYLDQHGKARVEGTDAGACEVSFPQLDGHDWEPA
jgi:type VI secretion system secreted protein VgrG